MKISLILLAAGSSRRFGKNKLLTDIGGRKMYRHIAEAVASLPKDVFSRKIVVTQYEEIRRELEKENYTVVWNDKSEEGISRSVRLGLKELFRDENSREEIEEDSIERKKEGKKGKIEKTGEPLAACFVVCDQPYLTGETILKLLQEWKASGKGIGCLGAEGRKGNPAIFSEKYFSELKELHGDRGGSQVMALHMDDLYICETEEQELKDIDLPEEFKR